MSEINWPLTIFIVVINAVAMTILWDVSGKAAKHWYWLNRELESDNLNLKDTNSRLRNRIEQHVQTVDSMTQGSNIQAYSLLQSLYIASQEDSDFDIRQALARFKKRTIKNKLEKSK